MPDWPHGYETQTTQRYQPARQVHYGHRDGRARTAQDRRGEGPCRSCARPQGRIEGREGARRSFVSEKEIVDCTKSSSGTLESSKKASVDSTHPCQARAYILLPRSLPFLSGNSPPTLPLSVEGMYNVFYWLLNAKSPAPARDNRALQFSSRQALEAGSMVFYGHAMWRRTCVRYKT